MSKTTPLLIAMLLTPSVSYAQNYDHCTTIVTSGLRDYNVSTTNSQYLSTVFDRFCESSGSMRTSSSHIGLSVVADLLPVSLSGGESSVEQRVRSFCKNYASTHAQSSYTYDYSAKTVARAYDTFGECVRLTAQGVHISHRIVSLAASSITLTAGTNSLISLQGIVLSKNIKCKGQNPKGKLIDYDASTNFSIDKTLGIICERTGSASPQGQVVYDEGTIQIVTNYGSYDIFLPRDERLSENQATALHVKIEGLERDLAKAHARISGINLRTEDAGQGEFVCGGSDRRAGGLTFMDGQRDGTGCGIKNLNFYKSLSLWIPPIR